MTQSQGVVKSFSTRNGYGFIADNSGGEDFFFGKEQIPAEWVALGPKLEGMEVVYEVANGKEGRAQARNVQPAGPPQAGQITSGVVKSWNSQKGYGFIAAPGLNGDVFFARDKLPREFRELSHFNGLTMIFELAQKPDGKYQAENLIVPQHEGKVQKNGPAPEAPRLNFERPAKRPLPVLAPEPAFVPQNQKRPKKESFDGTDRRFGVVKSFSSKNGFGFILCNGAVEDIIFYQKDAQGLPKPGDNVEFIVRRNSNGREQAYSVVPKGGAHHQGGSLPESNLVSNFVPTTKEYPPLSVEDLKLYAEQLNRNDLIELTQFSADILQMKLI